MQYCSSQHQILLSSADTSTTEHSFSFGSATSFFLELLVTVFCSSPVIYWTLSDLAEKAMAPHSSTLAWKIPWTEEPGRLQSMGSLRVGHEWATSLSLFTFLHWRRKWQPTPVFLLGESQGGGAWGGGVHLWCHYLFAFYTVHGVITTRILEQFAILLSIRPHFVRTFHYALSVLGGPASLSYASSFAMTR